VTKIPRTAAQISSLRRRRRVVLATVSAAAIAAGVAATASAGPGRPNAGHPLAGTRPAWATPAADRGQTPAATPLDIRVYLAGQNPQGLEAYARAVSDPNSPSYRHYLDPAQTKAAYGPSARQVAAVTDWLTGAGLTVTGTTDEYVSVHGSAGAISAALGTQFHQYASGKGPRRAPSRDVTVPTTVADAVLGITGLSQSSFTEKPSQVSSGGGVDGTGSVDSNDRSTVASGATASGVPYLGTLPCSAYHGEQTATTLPPLNGSSAPWAVCGYVPSQVRGAYGVTGTGLTGKGVTVAVVDAYGLPSMKADADKYAVLHGDKPFKPNQYSEIVTPNLWTETDLCGGADGWAGEEALDVESVHGMAPDANILYVGANSCFDTAGGGSAPNGGLLDSLALIVDHRLADMVSNSWGSIMHGLDGSGNPSDIDPALISAYEQVFKKGAVEGIGFYFSSGDCGDDNPATSCGANVGSARSQLEYPTSDPWVTSVGGTSIAIDKNNNALYQTGWQSATQSLTPDRTAWTAPKYLYGGGGGTSEDFAEPWYQTISVPASLSTHLLNGTTTSPKRVGPDVAAYGDPSTGFLEGYTQALPDGTTGYGESRIGGTSLSCPTFVGIQADAQQAQHGFPIGFANPEIYGRDLLHLFSDVTDKPLGPSTTPGVVRNGLTNPALRTFGQGIDQHATAGFDNATGVGTPGRRYLMSFKF
jgi:subtilase family serine protease